ncbi:MAG TPA: hypothetical protein VGE16_15155 [Albitalea sp.]
MFDRIFSAALAFCVLAGGTLAVGTAMLEQAPSDVQIVYLPRVEITGKRAASAPQLAQAEQTATTQAQ